MRFLPKIFRKKDPHDLDDFIDRADAAILLQPAQRSRLLLWTLVALIAFLLTWSAFAELDEVTRGVGKVIPSMQLQVIQNLEGGILEELFVHEGDIVERDQPLLRIDETRFRSDLQELQQALFYSLATVARLNAELGSVKIGIEELTTANWREQLSLTTVAIQFGDRLDTSHPEIREQAQAQYSERLRNLANQVHILESEIEQTIQDRRELESKTGHLETSYRLGQEELSLTEPLAEEGVVPRIELIKLEREVNGQLSELSSARLMLPKIDSEIMSAIYKRRDVALQFRAETQEKLAEVQFQLAQQLETRVGLEDKVDRTLVLSPVAGTVKRIIVNTQGGVIQPGMNVMEIVPSEDRLLVEARVSPKDIAFLRPGLDTTVRFTAYDFAIYGGMKGTLEHISADTIKNDEGEEFYRVRIWTARTAEGTGIQSLPIIPGMTATVDIITGQKTVLDYLIKPILRAKQRALTER
ncbi:MAG: adhesin transport system membrane fusion protein [Motiliproteus sp.]|jgi:adhesin transport system membrane fusion protein